MVVVALSQTENVSALRAELTRAGLSPDDLECVGPDDAAGSLAGDRAESSIITSDRGMSVPGITDDRRQAVLSDDSVTDRLGALGIPEKEFDNYLEAVERGKTVVACFAKADSVDKIAAAFTAANLINVRQY